jgi:hypothetical protein
LRKFGAFIRRQREVKKIALRKMATLIGVSSKQRS